MCRQLQMIRRLGYVRQVMIGGDPRGAQDFGRVVLPGPARPHARTRTFLWPRLFAIGFYLHKECQFAEIGFYLHKERCAAEGCILSTQRTFGEKSCENNGISKNFPRCARQFGKNFLRKIMTNQWYSKKIFPRCARQFVKSFFWKSWEINDIAKNFSRCARQFVKNFF